MTNSFATDGRCHNAEPGTFNHECGKPATWIGTKANGFKSGFCDDCKERGWERHGYETWERVFSADEIAVIRERHFGWEKASPAQLAAIFGTTHQRITAILKEGAV